MTIRVHFLMLAAALCIGALIFSACKDNPPVTSNSQSVTLSGVARDEQGFIIPNALITVVNPANTVVATDTTDEFGIFELRNLPNDYSLLKLQARHSDFKVYESPITSITTGGVANGTLLTMTHMDSACAHLSLTVSSQANGTPIEGAQVRLTRNEMLVTTVNTDQQGKVEFQYLMAGNYFIKVTKPGYLVYTRSLTMQYCDTMSLDIRLTAGTSGDSCCFGKLRITPKDSVTNTVMIGATVRLTGPQTQIRSKTATATGVLFEEMCPGTYAVRVSKDGYKVKEFSITMGCNDLKEETCSMVAAVPDSCCNGKIRIIPQVVVNNTPQTLVGASVRISKTGMDSKTYTSTQDGVLFTNLCPGTYNFRIAKDGYQVQEFSVTQTCDQIQEITRILTANAVDSCCNGKLRIIPQVKVNGVPQALVGATVQLSKTGMDTKSYVSDLSGVLFTGLCPGTYGIRVSKDGFQVQEFTVVQGCSQIQEITREMTANPGDSCCQGSITVVVKDSATSNPIQNVGVKLWKNSTVVATQTTGTNGSTIFTNRCEGTYQINLTHDGYRGKEYGFTLGCNEQKTIELTMAPPYPCNTAILKLRVKDSTIAEAGWLADATVILRKWVNNAWVVVDTSLTNSEGWYEKDGLEAPATYQVTVSKTGFVTKTFSFYFNECKTIQETIRLPK
jgi:5-hydroxyisourate hydrolase-like protein (transthyretin family)